MSQTAALWVEHLLPLLAYPQRVLSLPGPMAVRLGYNAALLGRVCRSFARRVGQSRRRRVKRRHQLDTVANLHPGIVAVVQRFRSDLGPYVHLHCLVTDGAFEASCGEQPPRFRGLPAPADSDLVDVLRRVAADLEEPMDEVPDIDSGIRACVALAASTPVYSAPSSVAPPMLNVHAFGMNLHAATTVDGRDSKRLERLCRYLLRPPFAQDSVHWLSQSAPTMLRPTDRAGSGWARLLARIFAIDVLACPSCGGRLAATAAVLDRDEIAQLLHGARGPPRPSPPGQLELLP